MTRAGRPRRGRRPMLVGRLRAGVGWRGAIGLLCFAGGLVVLAGPGLDGTSPGLWLVPLWTVAGAVLLVARLGRYRSTRRAPFWNEVVDPLLRSREEYCLLLRPFGRDGRVVLPELPRRLSLRLPIGPTATLEQVIARTVRKRLGLRTLGLVDQRDRFAPPGPTWLRSPSDGDAWQIPIDRLICRAYTIVLLLPPEEEIRPAVAWEVQRITVRHRQSRVIVVIPPPDQDMAGYLCAYHQMCTVLTAFEGYAGEVNPDDLRIPHYRRLMPKTTVLAMAARSGGGGPRFWTAGSGRFDRVAAGTYATALTEALAAVEGELSDLSFEERYPCEG